MTERREGYFLYHSIGQYPDKERQLGVAMEELASVWSASDDQQWSYLLGKRGEFIDLWRELIGAPAGSTTTCENVTQGVHMLMAALPADTLRGRKVLVAADCFPSNHFLLTRLQERLGFKLQTVRARQGAHWVSDEDMIAEWDRDVALTLITWVSSTSSHRVDLANLVAHGREMGSLIGVDITQASGLLPFSVDSPQIDFAVSTSLKWMCGTPGAGMLYVNPQLISDCRPELCGWFSQDNPFNWDIDTFEYAPDIRRFDNGTPAILPAAATVPALRWHAGIDRDALVRHNRLLGGILIEAADNLGLTLLTPRKEKARGGSLMFETGSTERAKAILASLNHAGFSADSRGSTLRLSPGVQTSEDATRELVEVLEKSFHAVNKGSGRH
ncbi:aminotransferase class V-fold PLP-dependent enzyme [Hoeflea prorocentri]|uniref:Aminotransferase class V-fold PLP-dependent enzyme n=1 Tax=Hoeflea prorocentri TaxID=1922333 RepID=A0A9X3UG08_9HYPH|nr:aminotransferase class V-fold PLP-dependent enzyme [Hoeflea prorocentri]MCY6380658.1 aminotransferase class V-fold PLP-dependent enzyme [Hoeflea prorocentri]MDA5398458.1 aminotransferase class V-fold PLP-dependent enzyme [Hoeflea prorocentri]